MEMQTIERDPFRPYTEIPSRLPNWFWQIARLIVMGITLGLIASLIIIPQTGIVVFWKLFIPSLPLVFAIVPGLWRQVCPMAFLNQIPVRNGFSAGKTLPLALKESSYLYAILLFIGLVALKHVTLYNSPEPLLAMLIGGLGLAFLGGLVYKGRSGWCGTFCPLGPLQKVYGHVPPVLVKNGYCETCVGCQKNCYDFSPRSAFFQDLYDKDAWYAGHRRFFVGVLPGLILSFWLGRNPVVIGYGQYIQELAFWLLVSAGSFFILTSVLRTSVYKVAAIYGVTAIFLYYYFAAPVMIEALRDVFGLALPEVLAYVIQAAVVVVAARNLWAGLRLEQKYWARETGIEPRLGVVGGTPGGKGAVTDAASILEKSSGKRIPLDPNRSLLELLESSGLKIDFGCRTGMCGADPIVIESGAEHLSPPSDTELETLRRLGLEGKARLACVCRAKKGPIAINLAADPQAVAGDRPAIRTEDMAVIAGVQRVVIIGNGVAGVTAADRIRQASESCQIDLISRENHHFYNRMAIGRAIYGRAGLDGLDLLPANWEKKNNVTVWLNTIARNIDRDAKEVVLGTGERLPYDKLILATGGRAAVPPVPGHKLPGCFVLREAKDALEIRAWSQMHGGRKAVVVGGGVLGIEAADALRQLGLDVTIVHRSDRLMDRNLDAKGSGVLESYLRGLGFRVETEAEIENVHGDDRVAGVTLKDGRVLDADVVLFCIGVKGETSLARDAGLKTNRGIVVNTAMRTSDPDIYAIGDVAEFGNGPSGLWTLATQHAQLAADDLLKRREGSSVPRTVMKLKMEGIDVVAYGEHELSSLGQEIILDTEEDEQRRRMLLIENGRVVGAVFVGPPGTALGVADLIREEKNVSPLLPELRRGNWDVLADDPDALGADEDFEDDANAFDPPVAPAKGNIFAGPLGWGIAMVVGAAVSAVIAMSLGMMPDGVRLDKAMHVVSDAFIPKKAKPGDTAITGRQPLDRSADTTVANAGDRAGSTTEPASGENMPAPPTRAPKSPNREASNTRAAPEQGGRQPRPAEPASEPIATTPEVPDAPPAKPESGAVANEPAAASGGNTPTPTVSPTPPVKVPAETTTQPAETTPTVVRPEAPTRPAAPTSQTGSTESNTPTTSAEPQPPVTATQPQQPTQPSAPVKTTAPVKEPVAPAKPVAPPKPTAPATPVRLEGEAFKTAVAAKRIVGSNAFGADQFDLRLTASGGLSGTFTQRGTFASQLFDNGRWNISGKEFCVRFTFIAGGQATCVLGENGPDGIKFLSRGERTLDWRITE